MRKVYVIEAKRSPIGSYLGSLANMHPREFGSQVLKSMLETSQINVDDINEVLLGNILPAGLGQGIARQISIDSGIPVTVPAYQLNMVCGSGMKTVMQASTSIMLGLQNLVIAGGVESMSGTPYLVPGKVRQGVKMGNQVMLDHMIHDALTDSFHGYHMGVTAENIAEQYNITRDQQDEFSLQSQLKARLARDELKFKDEIVPITIQTKKGNIVFDTDEYINDTTTLEKLKMLKTAFKENGTVTAGSSSGINDGASFMVVASEDYALKNHLEPMAEIIGFGQGAVDPSVMGLGPTPAILHALEMANIDIKDIGLFELNEAFAAQALGVVHELTEALDVEASWILERTNVNGGAIALGHPVGASGNRIIVTLLHEMIKRDVSYGLASLCIGGGMGTAIILKR